jgi:TRAP-type C4-dicarboxylate transport system substrate-binding protein
VTETEQPAVFAVVEISTRWYEALPPDLRQIVDRDAARQAAALAPQVVEITKHAGEAWSASGGELIRLPADDQAAMVKILNGVGDEVANARPQLGAAYKIVTDAAQRTP